MIRRLIPLTACLLATAACGSHGVARGDRVAESIPIPPAEVTDFHYLYSRNCAGCHGSGGQTGAAISLDDPLYLAIADDATIRRVTAAGVPGTSMPAFARSSGGMLTDAQVDAIVSGMRSRWAKPDALGNVVPPPYSAKTPGDPAHGKVVFGVYCASCHGAGGRGGKASSIVNGSYLALVSDQDLRTVVIVGRPELGAPDWRGDVPNQPMSPQDISDVVAWLVSQRPQFPGQPYSSAVQSGGGVR